MEEHRVERFNIGAFCIINPTAINTIIVFIEGGREMTTREGSMKVFGIRRERDTQIYLNTFLRHILSGAKQIKKMLVLPMYYYITDKLLIFY